jgi:hypothetical protein
MPRIRTCGANLNFTTSSWCDAYFSKGIIIILQVIFSDTFDREFNPLWICKHEQNHPHSRYWSMNHTTFRNSTAMLLVTVVLHTSKAYLQKYSLKPKLRFSLKPGARGSIVVKALCYTLEGRRFKTRWGERFLSIYPILLAALDPGVYSSSNRNEYQKQTNNVSGE